MTFWEFLDRQVARVRCPPAREWLAVAMLGLTVWVLALIAEHPELTSNEFFKLLAQAIVIQGFLTTVLAFFFTASKSSERERENMSAALGVADKASEAARAAVVSATTSATGPDEPRA